MANISNPIGGRVGGSQIAEQYSRLKDLGRENENLLLEVITRLEPVLTPEPSQEPASSLAPEPYLVPQAHGLRDLGDVAARLNTLLRNILDRIQL